MTTFERDGHRIAYEVHGVGRPVLLLHGVTVSFARNYAAWGWIQRLNAAGYQVIGMDFRGHGSSDKPRDQAAYGTDNLAGDVLALNLLHRAPKRIGASVLIATGDGLLGHPPYTSGEVFARLENALAREQFPEDLPSHEPFCAAPTSKYPVRTTSFSVGTKQRFPPSSGSSACTTASRASKAANGGVLRRHGLTLLRRRTALLQRSHRPPTQTL
jgi:hypothetical protein